MLTQTSVSRRAFACAPDAQAALEQERHQLPAWRVAQTAVVAVPQYGRVGRPRQDTQPVKQEWHIQAPLHRDAEAVEREVRRKAAFLVATTVLDETALSDRELIHTYQAPSAVEMDCTQMTNFVGRGTLILR